MKTLVTSMVPARRSPAEQQHVGSNPIRPSRAVRVIAQQFLPPRGHSQCHALSADYPFGDEATSRAVLSEQQLLMRAQYRSTNSDERSNYRMRIEPIAATESGKERTMSVLTPIRKPSPLE
jgi:hypothetical protein